MPDVWIVTATEPGKYFAPDVLAELLVEPRDARARLRVHRGVDARFRLRVHRGVASGEIRKSGGCPRSGAEAAPCSSGTKPERLSALDANSLQAQDRWLLAISNAAPRVRALAARPA